MPEVSEGKVTFAWGKLVTFLLANVLAGLIQLWILFLILLATNKDWSITNLLGDGGLFFFATGLTFNSLLVLMDKRDLRAGSSDLNVSLLTCLAVGGVSLVFYTAVLSQGTKVPDPFGGHILPQLSCAALAVVYAFYVAVRTGYFSS